ncbi:hypothetical protein ACKFKF_32875, partial [Phormidesmis sp. 146-12]
YFPPSFLSRFPEFCQSSRITPTLIRTIKKAESPANQPHPLSLIPHPSQPTSIATANRSNALNSKSIGCPKPTLSAPSSELHSKVDFSVRRLTTVVNTDG